MASRLAPPPALSVLTKSPGTAECIRKNAIEPANKNVGKISNKRLITYLIIKKKIL